MQIIVESSDSLLNILSKLAPGSSKTTLRSWLKEGRIDVDGEIVKQGTLVVAKGQKVSLVAKVQFAGGGIRIIYEDKHLVAIEKPKGLLSVATAFEKGDTAHGYLKAHYHPRRVHVVHRLDQDTSGVMLYALSEEGYEGLKALFPEHEIERSYYAIVEGHPSPSSGTWKSYLYEDNLYVVHSTTDPEKGRLATTHYETKKVSSHYSLLELKLETGRKNQIRVHCADSGHPVAGDKKYGATTDPLHRLCLHAAFIAFVHPVTGKKMHFASPVPQSFDRLFTN